MRNYKNNYQKINLVTKIGEFFLYVWPSRYGREPVALATKKIDVKKPVLVRIHSECINADVFQGKSCDCGEQKIKSLKMIYESGNGIFIYDREEGRGIGLFNKVKALKLQEQGLNTYEANIKLGHPADVRSYKVACEILDALKIKKIRLITNNPLKVEALITNGIVIKERVSLVIRRNKFNGAYLKAKKEIGKHYL